MKIIEVLEEGMVIAQRKRDLAVFQESKALSGYSLMNSGFQDLDQAREWAGKQTTTYRNKVAAQVAAFLVDLSALTEKHQVRIDGCGCCGSPWVDWDDVGKGHYKETDFNIRWVTEKAS
jgi:hypothetical protein